jgi:hypothetical protein
VLSMPGIHAVPNVSVTVWLAEDCEVPSKVDALALCIAPGICAEVFGKRNHPMPARSLRKVSRVRARPPAAP